MRTPEPSGRPGAGALACACLAGAAILVGAFAGDGSDVDGVLPVGGVAVVLLAVLLVAFSLGALDVARVGPPGALLAGALLGLVVWTGVSITWSIAPDRSWDTFNRAAAFTLFLGLGVVLAGAGGRRAARLAAAVLSLAIGAVLIWALLSKAVPALDPEGDRIARLREPVGYWNALALLADLALPLGLWIGAASGRRPQLRLAGALLAYVAVLALLLTISRSGLVAAVAVVFLWLALSRERVEGGLLLVAAGVPAALVGGWAFTRPALVEDGAARADRVSDGALFGGLTVVGAVVVVAIVSFGLRRGLEPELRRRAARGLLGAAAVAVVAGIVAVGVAVGNPVTWVDEEVTGPSCSEVENDPSRLGSLNLNNRWCWWNQAIDVYSFHAPEGAGAGTFEVARKRFRQDVRNVSQPHSVPLQQLADGGVVALALFVLVVVGAAAVCVSALRRLRDSERAAAVALVAAPLAYLLHALVDYTWDFLAATAPTMLALGALAGAGRPVLERRRRPFLALASVLVAIAFLYSFASPRLAERNVRASTRALDDGDLSKARDRALWARFFNPLAVDPVFALARIDERRLLVRGAERRYIQAVELQPSNPETWYALGIYEFDVRENMCAAYVYLNNAYTLDPSGSQWTRGGPLDVARAAVDRGACGED